MSQSPHQLKYRAGAQNPLVGRLLNRFLHQVETAIADSSPASILDVGCGDGSFLSALTGPLTPNYLGIDTDRKAISRCASLHPECRFTVGEIQHLPLPDHSQDTVLCLEVLEHLENPGIGLQELLRVAAQGLILSVPWEPWFTMGNLARGQYLRTWGNHPEHVQHWYPRSFERFLRSFSPRARIRFYPAWPWILVRLVPCMKGSATICPTEART